MTWFEKKENVRLPVKLIWRNEDVLDTPKGQLVAVWVLIIQCITEPTNNYKSLNHNYLGLAV